MTARIIPRHSQIINIRSFEYLKALSFMNMHFRDDPLVRAFKVPNSAEYRKVISLIWLNALKRDLSLKFIFAPEDHTAPFIAGVAVNGPSTPQDSFNNFDKFTRLLSCGPVMNLLSAWSVIEIEPNFNIDRGQSVFEISGVSVSKKFRRLGIARRLFASSLILAESKGYDYIKVDCTSPHSSKICEDLGFSLIWEKRFLSFYGVDKENVRYNDRVCVYIKKISAKENEAQDEEITNVDNTYNEKEIKNEDNITK